MRIQYCLMKWCGVGDQYEWSGDYLRMNMVTNMNYVVANMIFFGG